MSSLEATLFVIWLVPVFMVGIISILVFIRSNPTQSITVTPRDRRPLERRRIRTDRDPVEQAYGLVSQYPLETVPVDATGETYIATVFLN